jgi:hypothetical protein
MDIDRLKHALEQAWSKDTCYPPLADDWEAYHPAYGQCAVTVLIVHDYFGGEIPGCDHFHHYWNRLPDGREIDLTKEQFHFNPGICEDKVATREYLLDSESAKKAKTREKYELLKRRVEESLAKE